MVDKYAGHTSGLESPATIHYVIGASADPLDPRPRALRVNVGGTLTAVDELGVSVSYDVTAGEILPFRAVAVTACPAGTVAWL